MSLVAFDGAAERRNPALIAMACALSLSVAACSGGGAGESSTVESAAPFPLTPEIALDDRRIIPTEDAVAFRPDGPYASVLSECALSSSDSACSLSTLPYIGHDTENPTIDDILNRVVVTHEWMGVRFGQLLEAMPGDILPMFRPVTSIIIGSDVRPSSFNRSLGRMQIDAGHLWLTVPEKRTISTAADFRSEFGADLLFESRWRLMIGDEYAIRFSSLQDDNEREFEDALLRAVRPLYHELAHANDYVRPDNISSLSLDLTPGEAAGMFQEQRIAERLYDDVSLTAQTSFLYPLASVRYRDSEPTDFQRTVLADFVGSEMSNEGKSRFYGYFSIREDVATLFDQFMMKYHFGMDTHVGFFNKPDSHPDAACNEYVVAWGTRNRIASPLVAPRAKWVVERMIGTSSDLDSFFASSLGEESPLRVGEGWCNSRFSDPVLANLDGRSVADDAELLKWERALFSDHVQ